MKTPPINIGVLGGKSTKFRLSYSRTPNFQLPEFIPKEKRQGELTVAMHYCSALIKNNRKIEGVVLNEDDSNKQGDVIIYENGSKWYAQITRLTFNEYERRKVHNRRLSIEFAKAIQNQIQIDFPLIVSLFPKDKHKVPIDQIKYKQRTNIEEELIAFTVSSIKNNLAVLSKREENIRIDHLSKKLGEFYDGMDLCPVPLEHYASVPGIGNVFVNYKFYDSTYDDDDIASELQKMYESKNNGHADELLIWANGHELLNEKKIYHRIQAKFRASTFKRVLFMVFSLDSKIYVIK